MHELIKLSIPEELRLHIDALAQDKGLQVEDYILSLIESRLSSPEYKLEKASFSNIAYGFLAAEEKQ